MIAEHDVHAQSPVSSSLEGSISTPEVAPDDSVRKSIPEKVEAPIFPPPKTDKPRPHVCITCTRSFARLEHLKRHERSHTKEKPFACPECARCFARRDLLLRHQQKLHSTTTPSVRPRNGRRESVASTATSGGRVRKNSTTNPPMRPRASTFSQGDRRDGSILAAINSNAPRTGQPLRSHHNSISGFPGSSGFDFRASSAIPSHSHHLPRIETSGIPMDFSGGLRTAPVYGGFPQDFSMSDFQFGHGNTINPAQLHFGGASPGLRTESPYQQMFSGMSASQLMMEEEHNYDWMSGFDHTLTFGNNESAIDGSSPSAMSTGEGMNDGVMDTSHTSMPVSTMGAAPMWSAAFMNQLPMASTPQTLDPYQTGFGPMVSPPADMMSPRTLLAQNSSIDPNFSPIPQLPFSMDSLALYQQLPGQSFDLPMNPNVDTPTTSCDSIGSSLRHSSVTSVSTDSINDSTRKVLLHSLSRMPGFGERRPSQTGTKSNTAVMSRSFTSSSFPSALDLQRYVSAYIQYFQPHLPFLHVPTLNFDSSAYRTIIKMPDGQTQRGPSGIAGGGGCLILAMAAVGALYEFEFSDSKELFEASKRLLGGYLEARRRKTMNRAQYNQTESDSTPLWLVQAMFLNVIYGHNCGDKTSADIASVHCAALVSLARAAELARPDAAPHDDDRSGDEECLEDADWIEWKKVEERKRTLYAVFILSSLLVSAYNHSPALTNSEIRLDLPCDEALWEADSAIKWRSMGGASVSQSNSVSFAYALSHLLTASQRQPSHSGSGQQPFGSGIKIENIPSSDLRPSTFGCLILINALHNYIWETRQRHLGPIWTKEETDQMHAHIEPALRAWQAAWASNPAHSPERPNPFGLGPLSADSIPLLDLAYVRLFVNLGRSKEAFWQRDWDAMANELACGNEIVQHADNTIPEGSDHKGNHGGNPVPHNALPMIEPDLSLLDTPTQEQPNPDDDPKVSQPHQGGQGSRRERHLRKAAFYAADSLSHSDKLGISLAEHTSRELPLQSAMCAFDCAQVLAEWITTVQERIGRYVGIIGQDDIDLTQIPAIMLLEEEDIKLVEKIVDVLRSAEMKMMGTGLPIQGLQVSDVASGDGGYGSKILTVTANMLERAAVWPVTKLMARCLETQAAHMKDRARHSILGLT